MPRRFALCLGIAGLIWAAAPHDVSAQAGSDIPRTPSGRPDLSGTYDTSTVTPLQRPREFGDRLTLTQEEAAIIASDPDGLARVFGLAPAGSDERAAARAEQQRAGFETGDGNREAPPVGGDGSGGAAGNVGGYNTFWIDRGDAAFQIDGLVRTSIITDPPNGRQPPLTDSARAARAARAGFARPNDGTAWWLEDDLEAPGPYDNPEQRPHAERCLMGFGSTAGPPMLSVLYNNMKRIVQTEDTVVILVEMVHDARIVRMNAEHNPPETQELARRLGRPLGGGHPRRRHHQLHRQPVVRRRVPQPPRRRAVHPPRRRHPALPVHGGRPHGVDRPLERRVHLARLGRPGLRVRLPRGELLVRRHPARRPGPRGGRQARGRSRRARLTAVDYAPGLERRTGPVLLVHFSASPSTSARTRPLLGRTLQWTHGWGASRTCPAGDAGGPQDWSQALTTQHAHWQLAASVAVAAVPGRVKRRQCSMSVGRGSREPLPPDRYLLCPPRS